MEVQLTPNRTLAPSTPQASALAAAAFPQGAPEGKPWVSPVGVLRAHMHLQENALRESLKALAALPEVPVAELGVQLAGRGWARQDPLILHVDLVKSCLNRPRFIQ